MAEELARISALFRDAVSQHRSPLKRAREDAMDVDEPPFCRPAVHASSGGGAAPSSGPSSSDGSQRMLPVVIPDDDEDVPVATGASLQSLDLSGAIVAAQILPSTSDKRT